MDSDGYDLDFGDYGSDFDSDFDQSGYDFDSEQGNSSVESSDEIESSGEIDRSSTSTTVEGVSNADDFEVEHPDPDNQLYEEKTVTDESGQETTIWEHKQEIDWPGDPFAEEEEDECTDQDHPSYDYDDLYEDDKRKKKKRRRRL